jgi:hypothetical protein
MNVIKRMIFFISSVCLFLCFLSGILIAQNQISISVLNNGGEMQSNANHLLVGTVGQAGVDIVTTTNYQVHSGFWYQYYQEVVVSVEDEDILPIEYKLEQNYPNPFNPSTVIKFAVPEKSSVLIKIYDILGSEINTLVNEELDAGWYQKNFNGSGYASGLFIYRMQAGNYISTKKMLLVK